MEKTYQILFFIIIILLIALYLLVPLFKVPDFTICRATNTVPFKEYEENKISPLFLQMYSKEFRLSYFELEKYIQITEKNLKAVDFVSKPSHIYIKSPEGELLACGYYK